MRVLFCGLGGIGQRHLRNLRELLGNELEVHAYRVRRQKIKLLDDLSIAKGADLEVDYEITVHDTLESGLVTKPDLVLICNPSNLHIPIAIAAARAGCNIFMEKPASNSLEGLSELQSIVSDKKLLCYVGYNLRFHPALQKIKYLIEHKFFGDIIGVQAEVGEYLPGWHKYEDYRDMYAARSDLGGGVILSQIHEMDLIFWFFGVPKSILCIGGKLSNFEIDVEDTAYSLMGYEGATGRFPITLHQDFIQRPPSRYFKVIGDKGIARADLIANKLEIFDVNGSCVELNDFPGFKRNEMFLSQTKHLLDCIKKDVTPLVDLNEGVQSLVIALGAKESLVSGREVQLSKWS